MTVMTVNDRRATEKYLKDLEQEFGVITVALFAARKAGVLGAPRERSARSASLYREITEVEVALERDALP